MCMVGLSLNEVSMCLDLITLIHILHAVLLLLKLFVLFISHLLPSGEPISSLTSGAGFTNDLRLSQSCLSQEFKSESFITANSWA